ncbi:MAG: ATP-binding cassette domain-containing protein [Endomicrobium sp.]|jgi:ATP-binding cassette subfamily F protein 3|nr:ATP-binding cassette domain-containing protein [Endomicrobium sp.]
MIKITNLNKAFGSRTLFDNLNLNINSKERIGLVGRNGHGKTTLLKMILGKMKYDLGSISMPKNYKLGYLEQHINFTQDTVLNEACLALPEEEKDSSWKAEKILSGLGFSASDMFKNPSEFSGGYKIRINLAKVLLSDADMLMLDEPNNYLDIVAIRWLSGFLRSWKGELMLITHDRSFMDSVITHCAAIHRTKARKIEGNTQKLYEQIEKEEEIYEKTRLNVEKRIKQTELFIRRFRAKARLAGMVQSRLKTIEKQDNLEKLDEVKTLGFSFSGLEFHAAKMLGVRNLAFGYDPDKLLISKLSFDVLKNERICVIGKNGKGKSTLLKLIAERLAPCDGSIKKRPDLKTAYFVQSDSANLNPQKTVFEEILASDKCLPQKARNIAGSMMFSGDDALKKIEVLSGGEKSRVLLGKILANPCHLLLLDEPTNHLDMQSCEGLIDAINKFRGSVVMVTHNEEMLRSIATKLIIFDRDKVSVFDGAYQDFLEKTGWEDEGCKIKAKTSQKILGKSKEEIKKLRAELIQEKSRILRPLEEKIKNIESGITKKEEEFNLNTQQLIEASQNGNISFLSEVSKLNKSLQAEIENFYMELACVFEKYEKESESFRNRLEKLEDNNPKI